MQITRQADYAVRAVLFLAQRDPGSRISTAKIAQAQKIPVTFLAKIISQLSAAGVVRAARGARGGVSLAKAPNEISLLDIVEAIDGPVKINECLNDPDLCVLADDCAVRPVWCNIQADLVAKLAQTKFGDLAGNGRKTMAAALPA